MSGAFYGTSRQGCPAQEASQVGAEGREREGDLPSRARSRDRPALRADVWPSGAVPQAGEEDPAGFGARGHCNSGVPTGAFLRGSYWRRKGGVPADFSGDADIARDPIGIIWMAPIVPFRREDLALVNGEMDALFARFDFDCHVTVNMINERALAAVYTISYDAEDDTESRRGGECYDAGVRRLFELGLSALRASVRGMGCSVPAATTSSWAPCGG